MVYKLFESFTQLQNSSFHIVDRTRKVGKCINVGEKTLVQSVRNYRFLSENMQICDVLVGAVFA